MKAEQLVQSGDVQAALQELQQRVRAQPDNAANRIFLFQLLAVLGQWKRALTQLEVVRELDTSAWPMVHAYREAVNCELHREAVFQGRSKPLVVGEPQEWMAFLIEAQQAFARGELAGFRRLNQQAFEQAPAIAGSINEEPFEWLADADQRFGPVLEMIFNGQYYWAPLQGIKSLRSEEPTDLRDLVWLPAEVTWVNGGQSMVMLPARYPLLAGVSNECLLARRTDWQARGEEISEGLGQRMLATDRSDYPILQVRSVILEVQR
jgi:type VI secretion system protein ImpE